MIVNNLKVFDLSYKFLLIYIFTHYILQIFVQFIFVEKLSVKFNGWDFSPLYAINTIVFFFIVFFIVDKVIPKFKINKTILINSGIKYLCIFIFLFIYLFISINFKLQYGIDFRHTNRLSNAGILVQLLPLFRVFATFLIFLYFVKVIRNIYLNKKDKLIIIIIGLCFLLTTTSSLQTLIFLPLLMLIFFNQSKLYNILSNKNIRISSYIKIGVLFSIIAFIAIFIGIANKWGVERSISLFIDLDKIYFLTELVATRVSTSYFSLLIMAKEHIFNFDLQFEIYLMHFDTFLHRLSVLLPIVDYKIDDVRTINHENFLLLYQNNLKETTGAAPGLLASIFYLPLFPINFILMSMYLVLIFRILDIYLDYKNINFLAIVIFFYLLYTLFGAPPGILKIIDPSAIFFLLFSMGVFFIEKSVDNKQILIKEKY